MTKSTLILPSLESNYTLVNPRLISVKLSDFNSIAAPNDEII